MSVLKRVTKCDICGEYGCDLDGRLKIKQRQSLWWESWMTRFDICPKCSFFMKEWIRRNKRLSESTSTDHKVVGVTKSAVLDELHAQVAVGNLKEEVAGDIIANLFEEGDE